MKLCTGCGTVEITAESAFLYKGRPRAQCKACHSRDAAERYQKNKQRYAERSKAYREANPEAHKARSRAWHAKNKDRKRELSRAWSSKNRQKRRDLARSYYHADLEKSLFLKTGRRARARGVTVCTLTLDEWRLISSKYAGLCAYCLAPATEMDHVLPIARGGQHTADNVLPSCKSCNSRKRNFLLPEWFARILIGAGTEAA